MRQYRYSAVVICPARVNLLPLDQAERSDTDEGVYDGVAEGGACAGGH